MGLYRQPGIHGANIVDQALLLNARWHTDGLRLHETGERHATTDDGGQFARHTAKSTDTRASWKVPF